MTAEDEASDLRRKLGQALETIAQLELENAALRKQLAELSKARLALVPPEAG